MNAVTAAQVVWIRDRWILRNLPFCLVKQLFKQVAHPFAVTCLTQCLEFLLICQLFFHIENLCVALHPCLFESIQICILTRSPRHNIELELVTCPIRILLVTIPRRSQDSTLVEMLGPNNLRRNSLRDGVTFRSQFHLISFWTCLWVTRLNHEVTHHTMKCNACVHSVLHILYKVVPMSGGVIVEFYTNLTCCGFKHYLRFLPSFCASHAHHAASPQQHGNNILHFVPFFVWQRYYFSCDN